MTADPLQERRGPLRPVRRRELTGPVPEVAACLLGAVLVRREDDGTRTLVRVVEVEAYDEADAASHTFRGPTRGNATMFGPAGHAYVYFTYGMHHCVNVVTGPPGHGAAVLLRAGVVLEGHALARARRHTARRDVDLAAGPARLTTAMAIDRGLDGVDLTVRSGPLWLARDDATVPPDRVAVGPRVGVRQAADHAWRFWVTGVAQVSTYRRHPRAP
jgi:DNA-3-methyladenine glycosylase